MKRKPVVLKPQTVKGRVHINEERCKGCGFCIEFCPKSVLAFSSKFNSKGYHPPYAAQPEECINCNLCQLVCPEFAIFSVPVNEKRSYAVEHSVEASNAVTMVTA